MQMRSSLIRLVQVKKYDCVDREGKIHRRELTSFSCDSRIIQASFAQGSQRYKTFNYFRVHVKVCVREGRHFCDVHTKRQESLNVGILENLGTKKQKPDYLAEERSLVPGTIHRWVE